jgi:photosystem II stability/assembly factor-like uncharacterized protein
LSGRCSVCAAILGIVIGLAGCTEGASRSTDRPTRSPSTTASTPSQHSAASAPQTPVPASQLRLVTRERVPAETLRANGIPIGYGLQRDGTLLVVWGDALADDDYYADEPRCRRAYLLQPPTGAATIGPLPDGGCWTNPVTSARSGFVIDGHTPSLVRPDGSVERFRSVSERVLRGGDLAGASRLGRLQVFQPSSATMFTLSVDRDISPRLLSGGKVWGHARLPANGVTSATAVWSRDARSWGRFSFDTGTREDWGTCCYFFEIAAAGPRAAAWACGDVASGGVCGDRLAITTNAGDTWTTMDPRERPFARIGAGVASGDTLVITPSRMRHSVWRSTNDEWTRFAQVDLPRGAREVRAEDGGFSASIQKGPKGITMILRIDETGVVHKLSISDPPPLPAPSQTGTPLSKESEFVQKASGVDPVLGSQDGSLLLAHYRDDEESLGGQLLRIVRPDGLVRAYFSGDVPTQGVGAGFLVLDGPVDDASYVDSAGETHRVDVVPAPFTPESGDTALALPGGRKLAVFRASDQTIHPLPGPSLRRRQWISAAALDAQGTLWVMVGGSVRWSLDNGATWRRRDLDPVHRFNPDEDFFDMVVAGGTTVVYDTSGLGVTPHSGKITFTTDQGRNWRTLARPRGFTGTRMHVLADGRILLGPQAGQYWRAASARNSGFEMIDAGPIVSLVVAGESVYALPYGESIGPGVTPADRGLVWVSRDNANTWVVATR